MRSSHVSLFSLQGHPHFNPQHFCFMRIDAMKDEQRASFMEIVLFATMGGSSLKEQQVQMELIQKK